MEIELLPWNHDFKSAHHKDLINYLLTIPRGSTLAIEMSPGFIDFFGMFNAMLRGQKVSPTSSNKEARALMARALRYNRFGLVKSSMNDALWANFELYLAAQRRNLRLIPMETTASRYKAINEGFVAYPFREQTFARIIAQQNTNKVYSVMGSDHVEEVQKYLKEKGIFSKINLSYLKDPRTIALSMAAIRKYRTVFGEKRFFKMLIEKRNVEQSNPFKLRTTWKQDKNDLIKGIRARVK